LPVAKELVERIAFSADFRLKRSVPAFWRGQLAPGRRDFRRGERQRGIVQHIPDVFDEARFDFLLLRKFRQRHIAQAEFAPMLETPGREERFRIMIQSKRKSALARTGAKPVLPVNLANAIDRRKLLSRLAGIAVELQRPRADDRVRGDSLRGFEITLQRRVLNELHIANVGESLATHRVAHERALQSEIEAREVLNRVSVLGAGEMPHRDPARIARVVVNEFVERLPRGGDKFLPLRIARLRFFLRRHFVLLELRDDLFPRLEQTREVRFGGHAFEIDLSLRLFVAVAVEAKLLERWCRARHEFSLGGGRTACRGNGSTEGVATRCQAEKQNREVSEEF
jgi:hypothetical protein